MKAMARAVRLLSGISEGDQVMLNIGQSISEGDQVQPEEEKTQEPWSKAEGKKPDNPQREKSGK